jgi:hypothetical protein
MTLSQREAFARTMEHLCNHDSHGYTQGNRWGNGNKETVDLGDGVSVDIMLGDRDCSSAIISALSAVGVDVHDATYTGNMKNNILKSGLFEWWSIDNVAQRGDIYLNEACHTAMCTSAYGSAQGDILAEFSISENGTAYGNEGDQTAYESHICAYYDYPWDGILHWKNDGATLGAAPKHTVERVDRAVYRLYNPNNGQHMFTSSYDEAQALSDAGWTDEGVGWKYGDGGRVYRLYNAGSGDHFFTTGLLEVVESVMAGWKLEGVGFKQGSNTPVYRLYNKNSGQHFYTTNASERDSLKNNGWTDEGEAFKGA